MVPTYPNGYTYRPDGRLASIATADGGSAASRVVTATMQVLDSSVAPRAHDFTYEARGLLATQHDFDGTYRYAYDEVGRNTRLQFPDGHTRVQVHDDLGRVTSRCYEYADPSLNRCYRAQYDAVGNPLRLSDPEGSDDYAYDALDRLTKATRKDLNGLTVSEDVYAYNALGALATNASEPVDHRRPRLDGGGSADSAVPATLDAQPVGLDVGGRVTAVRGLAVGWDRTGQARTMVPPIPLAPSQFGFDSMRRRVWTVGSATLRGIPELYLYDGVHRVAAVNPTNVFPQGLIAMSFLYDGIDHPLRLGGTTVIAVPAPGSPYTSYSAGPHAVAYYELDLAGNVRRLRAPGGADHGGYRYSAFGATREDTVQSSIFGVIEDLDKQPLRWKGMWRFDVNGTELYDARARMWSPALGTFLSVDELVFHDPTSTPWAWPNQNPITFSDPFGRDGTTSNPIQDLVDSGFLPPGLTIFGKGTRLRATGISMMANDATVEAGIAKMNCGNAMIAAGAGVLATDAQVIGGIADAAIGAANALRGGGSYRAVRSANTGGEVHHMPSWNSLKRMGDSNPFSHGSAPGILMEKGDHMLTASWGRGLEHRSC